MKKLIMLMCMGLVFVVSGAAFAGAQQDKMKGCNKEAKTTGLKGDERKAFMSRCLKKDYVLKHKVVEAAEADAASGKSDNKRTASAETAISPAE